MSKSLLIACAAGVAVAATCAEAQQTGQLVEPIHRVAHEEAATEGQPAQLAARMPAAPASPFDLEQRPGEHPLMPALRLARESLHRIDTSMRDYKATLVKQERINGVLGEQEYAFVKVRHEPFSVYMYFLQPNKGRECLYNAAPGGMKGKLVAMDCGWKRRIGKVELDPEGALAMKGQKYPIMKMGVRNLTTELIDVASNDIKYAECTVTSKPSTINGRAVTLLEVVHPVPRDVFRFHKAEVFIDNELMIPIRYAAYLWPETPGAAPPLEEAYTYINVEVNNGFTDLDFDQNNPNIFKK